MMLYLYQQMMKNGGLPCSTRGIWECQWIWMKGKIQEHVLFSEHIYDIGIYRRLAFPADFPKQQFWE
jgi:hypothetical protein